MNAMKQNESKSKHFKNRSCLKLSVCVICVHVFVIIYFQSKLFVRVICYVLTAVALILFPFYRPNYRPIMSQ